MEEEYDWVNDTEFWRVLSGEFLNLYSRKSKLWKETNDSSVMSTSKWDEFDRRIEKLYTGLTILKNHLGDIKTTIKYMELNRLDAFLAHNKIERSEHSRFIYESHQIGIVSTLDILAKLGDLVYNSRIPLKYCNWNSFIKHKRIRETECAKILDEFSIMIWADKFERNQIIHVGGYKHSLIESIWSTEIDDSNLGNDQILKNYFSRKRIQGVEKLIDQMKSNHERALKYSIEFVESMADVLGNSLGTGDPKQHV